MNINSEFDCGFDKTKNTHFSFLLIDQYELEMANFTCAGRLFLMHILCFIKWIFELKCDLNGTQPNLVNGTIALHNSLGLFFFSLAQIKCDNYLNIHIDGRSFSCWMRKKKHHWALLFKETRSTVLIYLNIQYFYLVLFGNYIKRVRPTSMLSSMNSIAALRFEKKWKKKKQKQRKKYVLIVNLLVVTQHLL